MGSEDITAGAGGPGAVGGLSSFNNVQYNSEQVFYIGTDQQVHHFYAVPGTPWGVEDITTSTGAVPAAFGLSSYNDVQYNSQQVFYIGTDGHVHHFYTIPGNPWTLEDISANTGAPAAVGPALIGWADSQVTISGQVTAGGSGLSGVTVSLTGSSEAGDSISLSTTTDSNGNYSFSVPYGGSYTVTPSDAGYAFSPASYIFENLSSNQTADFAQASTPASIESWNGFLAVPSSSTTTPSASGCGDISGTWTETDQYGSSTWNLSEDSSGNVSRTVDFSNGPSCGTITYQTVTGQQSDGVFNLTASNPNALRDSCGFPVTPVEQQSVTLSTSGSCTSGSATWSSAFGQGTSTWKSPVASLVVVPNGVHTYSNAELIAAGFGSNCKGIIIGVTYQVLDQSGNPYKVAGLVPQEMLSNIVTDGIPHTPVPFLDPPVLFQFVDIYPGHPEKNTSSQGTFTDSPFGACA